MHCVYVQSLIVTLLDSGVSVNRNYRLAVNVVESVADFAVARNAGAVIA